MINDMRIWWYWQSWPHCSIQRRWQEGWEGKQSSVLSSPELASSYYFLLLMPEISYLCFIFLFRAPDTWDISFMLYFLISWCLRYFIYAIFSPELSSFYHFALRIPVIFCWNAIFSPQLASSNHFALPVPVIFWPRKFVMLSRLRQKVWRSDERTHSLEPPFFGVIWRINQFVQTKPGLCGRVWSWSLLCWSAT